MCMRFLYVFLIGLLWVWFSLPVKKELHILTYSDLFPLALVQQFEKEHNIKVVMNFIDSDEMIESKKLTGYDLITVSQTPYLARLAQNGLVQKMDYRRLTNLSQIDPIFLAHFSTVPETEGYGLPFFYGSFVIVYNQAYMEELGIPFRPDSYDVFFRPDLISQLAPYGVCMMEDFTNLFALTLHHLGYSYNSHDPSAIEHVYALHKTIRPYVRTYNNMRFISDLLIRQIIIALASTHETFKALSLKESHELRYVRDPSERLLWMDCFAMPVEGKQEAYAFIDFCLRPENAILMTEDTFLSNVVSHRYRSQLPAYLFLDQVETYTVHNLRDPATRKLFLTYWKSILQNVPLSSPFLKDWQPK